MKSLIAGLGSIGCRQLRWLFSASQSRLGFNEIFNPRLPMEESTKINLHFVRGKTGSVQLNYNQRSAACPLEIICQEITGRWISLIPGVQ
jgi:hypothetical protein